MAKKHSDKELQNMSVEELQSLKNDLLPQKERPNYDTRTGGGVCCDDTYGCCDNNCILCDGICPDDWIDPTECALCNSCCDMSTGCDDSFQNCEAHGCVDTIEYPDIYIRGISESYKIILAGYPFGDDFKNANFMDVVNNSFYELDGVTPKEHGVNDKVNIHYSTDGINKYLIVLTYFFGWGVTGDTEGIFTEDNGYKIPAGSGLHIGLAESGIIKWTLQGEINNASSN